MKRVLDFIKALGAFQGKRYDHSYIGRVSIAFWGEEDASCTFSCHRQWQKKSVECLRVEETNNAGILVGLLEALILFSPYIVPAIPKQDPFPMGTLWKTYSRESVIQFAKETGDMNPIHLAERPVVQGLLLLKDLAAYGNDPDFLSMTFSSPLYVGEPIYLEEEPCHDRKLYASSSRDFVRSIVRPEDDLDGCLCRAVSGFGVHFFSAAFYSGHGDGTHHHG